MSRFPLTAGGAALLAGVAGLLWWTHQSVHDFVLHVVAWSVVGLLFIAVLLTSTLGHRCKKHIARVLAGAPWHCGDRLPDAGRFLRIRYVQPPADDAHRVTRRGRYKEIRFRLLDPFEWISLEYVIKGADLMVLPSRTRPAGDWTLPPEFAAGEEWSAKGKPDGDLYEIGEYRRGDPLRLVLWKITARRGGNNLYVRRPETVGDSKLAYYFRTGPGDEATAELVYYMIRENQIRASDLLVFSNDQDENSAELEEDPLHRLAASGIHTARNIAENIRRFREEALRRRISACLVFLPAHNAEKHAANLQEMGLPTYFVAGIYASERIPESRDDSLKVQFIPMEQNHSA